MNTQCVHQFFSFFLSDFWMSLHTEKTPLAWREEGFWWMAKLPHQTSGSHLLMWFRLIMQMQQYGLFFSKVQQRWFLFRDFKLHYSCTSRMMSWWELCQWERTFCSVPTCGWTQKSTRLRKKTRESFQSYMTWDWTTVQTLRCSQTKEKAARVE